MADQFYISKSAWTEFQRQDVFETMEEFAAAMPQGTRSVHLLPQEIGSKVEGFRPMAGDENKFPSTLSQTFTSPSKEEPHKNDESMWRVENPNDIGKDQGQRDVTEIKQQNYSEPYDSSLIHMSDPVDGDTYQKDYDDRASRIQADYSPVVASVGGYGNKVAMQWNGIIDGLKSSIIESASKCKVSLKRANPQQGRWTFSVQSAGSDDTHTVHLKATSPKGTSSSNMPKLDLKLGCSCNFWKWQGPDHHAAQLGYLDRKPSSNGAAPTIRDPSNQNRVCKHVYACSELFMNYYLQKTKKSSLDDFYNRYASMNYPVVKSDGLPRRIKVVGLQLEAFGVEGVLVSAILDIYDSLVHTQG